MQWRYSIVASTGGQVSTAGGVFTIGQVLNSAGQSGGELVAVVPAGFNMFEWVIKFPLGAPMLAFEEPVKKMPPQQNLWVDSGSGSFPSV